MLGIEKNWVRILYNSPETKTRPKGTVITSINIAGEKNTTLLIPKKEKKCWSHPRSCQQISENKYFILLGNLLKDEYGIMTVE